MRRRLASAAVALASFFLVQVPTKDMRLSNPGSNMPPITQFKKVREFPSREACETYRDAFLKDSALVGSDAMLDQASSLRCVSSADLPQPTPAVTK